MKTPLMIFFTVVKCVLQFKFSIESMEVYA